MTIISEPPFAAEAPRPLERLEADLVELAGQLSAATCRFLVLVGEYDAAEGWRLWGMSSTAAWLSWHCGVGSTAAREQVRVVRVMRSHPDIVTEFAAGRLSYSKVRAITRIVTPDTAGTLLTWAAHATAAQIERVAAATRRTVRAQDTRARKAARAVSYRWDDDGSLVGTFRLPPEDGVRLVNALDIARAALPEPPVEVSDAERSAHEDVEGRWGHAAEEAPVTRTRRVAAADALLHLADTYLDGATRSAGVTGPEGANPTGLPGLPGLGAERHQLVIHASAEALAQPDDTETSSRPQSRWGLLPVLRLGSTRRRRDA